MLSSGTAVSARHSRSMEPRARRAAHSWRHFRDVILVLVGRDYKGRYKNTALGFLWSVISPLLFLLTFYFIFKLIIDLGIPRYATFVFSGVVAWTWFSSSLSQAVLSIPAHPNLVGQPGFPVAALPIVAVTSNLINFCISLPILLVILAIEGSAPTPALLLGLPPLIITQFVLTLSISYLVAAINVTFRDTQFILPIILQLGYYVTPIFYDIALVPAEYRPIFDLNPMVPLITAYRNLLMHGILPDWTLLAGIFAGSLVLLLAGYRYFQRARHRFLEEL